MAASPGRRPSRRFEVQGGTLTSPVSSDGGLTWQATLTPEANTSSSNNIILLNHAGVLDALGVAGSGSTQSNAYAVDTLVSPPPPASPTLVISSGAPVLGAGQSTTITFSFSVAPSGFTADDIAVSSGTLSGLAATADARVYTALFTVDGNAAGSIGVAAMPCTGAPAR